MDQSVSVILSRPVPDSYNQLIERMRFFIEPEISCSRFFGMACFTDESIEAYRQSSNPRDLQLSEMGTYIKDAINGGLFIDIPCGKHDVRDLKEDFDMIPLSQILGIKNYWEVDITADVISDRIANVIDVLEDGHYQHAELIGDIGERNVNGIDVLTMQDDLLGFIAKLSDSPTPKALYVSAIQPDVANFDQSTAAAYITALYDELARVCTEHDLIILNSSSMLVEGIDESQFPNIHPALALPGRGFQLLRRCKYDKVHVFRKG